MMMRRFVSRRTSPSLLTTRSSFNSSTLCIDLRHLEIVHTDYGARGIQTLRNMVEWCVPLPSISNHYSYRCPSSSVINNLLIALPTVTQHIIAHSLGTALIAHILSNQPTVVPPLSQLSTDPNEKREMNRSRFLFNTWLVRPARWTDTSTTETSLRQ